MIPETLGNLLAPIDAHLLAQLREHWRWAVGDELTAVGITTIGDWLFVDPEGAAYRLDTVEASLDRVAIDMDELGRLAASPDVRDDIFLEGLVLAVLRERTLPRNHCVGFRVPPILGGDFDPSNLEIVPIEPYQMWTGRLHEALGKVPAGREVVGVDVDDRGSVTVRLK